LASLQNYLSNEADRSHCLKRGGKAEFVRIDLEEAEDRYELEPIDKLTPEKIFDARWAVALLGEAMNRLDREYRAQGKESTFRALKAFLASVHKSLRLCDLCKELGFDCSDAHTVCEGWFGKLRPTLVWCSCAR
jgi:hypothetical protein